MLNHKVSLNDVVKQSVLLSDQKKHVLKAMKSLQPNFRPLYTEPEYRYSNILLKNMTCTNNAIVSPAKGLITTEELKSAMTVQLQNEIRGFIAVQSINANSNVESYTKSCVSCINWHFAKGLFSIRAPSFQREKLVKLEEHWRSTALKIFLRNLNILKNRESFNMRTKLGNIYPFLTALDTEVYVDAIMKEARELGENSRAYSPSLPALCRQLGFSIYQKYEVRSCFSCLMDIAKLTI